MDADIIIILYVVCLFCSFFVAFFVAYFYFVVWSNINKLTEYIYTMYIYVMFG